MINIHFKYFFKFKTFSSLNLTSCFTIIAGSGRWWSTTLVAVSVGVAFVCLSVLLFYHIWYVFPLPGNFSVCFVIPLQINEIIRSEGCSFVYVSFTRL